MEQCDQITTYQTLVNVATIRLDPSKVGWEGADRLFLVYECKPAQFTYTEPLKQTLNCLTCFESLLIETRIPKHCVLLVWQTNQVTLHHVKRESLSTLSVALAGYLLPSHYPGWIHYCLAVLGINVMSSAGEYEGRLWFWQKLSLVLW